MRTILVPHSATVSSVRMWICATDTSVAPGDISIRLSNGSAGIARGGNWRPVTAGGVLTSAESRTFTQVVSLTGLPPATRLTAQANDAQAGFMTLPATLPRVGERPFTVLLGSCYFGDRDLGLSATTDAMSHEVSVGLKILCGDQVYLDFPSFVLGVPFDEKGKANLFLSKYLKNWGEPSRYRSLLQEGATYFTSDDHEFWNNFPNPATIIAPTWTQAGRDEFERVARRMFEDFQSDPAQGVQICRQFNVGSLSFMIADTRWRRQLGDDTFMPDADLQTVVRWLENLNGPGVLVVGQPVFADPQTGFIGGLKRKFADRSLSDYRQYQELSTALLAAKRSVLILTGDVHYPRVADGVRPGETAEVVEIIASPAALVAGPHAQTQDAAGRFPSIPVAGKSLPVSTVDASRHTGDNLLLLDFTETPGRIQVQLRYWFIGNQPSQGPAINFSLS